MFKTIAACIVGIALAPAGSARAQGVGFDPAELRAGLAELRAGLVELRGDLPAQDREQARAAAERDRAQDRVERERDRELRAYEEAQRYLDRAEWERAAARFTDVAALNGTRADAALYWKAYSQNRIGQRAEALATIAALTKDHPNSRYLRQAKALEVEVRSESGQRVRPQDQADEELKLMAINAMQHSDAEQVVPQLEKLLEGNASPRVKERALFVLAITNSARGREVLKNIAKGSSTPDLQTRAIHYLGIHGGREAHGALSEVYSATNDVDVRKSVLRAFMIAGDKARVMTAAQSEQNAELRGYAVQQLGIMGAHEELSQLYQKENSVEVKQRIIQAMFVGGNVTKMTELARGEQNPELRRSAIQKLGLMGRKGGAGDTLVQIYGSDRDAATRRAVIQALFLQDNAEALVALARKEEDLTMKKEIVSKLGLMTKSPAARDYLVELLNK
jgi:HEAT repeat protein